MPIQDLYKMAKSKYREFATRSTVANKLANKRKDLMPSEQVDLNMKLKKELKKPNPTSAMEMAKNWGRRK